MDNNMDSMLDMYLFEANTLLEQLDEILINCEKRGMFDPSSINEIFRIMHTIKGSSAMMQFDSLMNIAHKIEDLFFYVRDHQVGDLHQGELFDLMFESCDFLKNEITHLENNEPLTIDIGELEQEIKDMLKKVSAQEDESDSSDEVTLDSSDEIEAEQPCSSNPTSRSIQVFFDENCEMENLRAFMLVKNLSSVCGNLTYEPSDVENKKSAEEIARNGFLVHLESADDIDAAVGIVESFVYTKSYSLLQAPNGQNDDDVNDETIDDTSSEASKPVREAMQNQQVATQSLINVNLNKLDKLMDLVGEIVITESMITSIKTDQDTWEDIFDKSTRELHKLTNELQEIVMSVRMLPVAGVFHKMNRIVRDMCKQLGKDVELILIGEDTELDKTIVDNIADPLMHIVRNSMDHGIETTEDRLVRGKDPKGKLELSAKNEGGEIIICITDDGKGLDAKQILERAENNGLLTKPKEAYTEKEIFQFIFLPGFSTKEAVSEFSGRGVGMDVVQTSLEKVGGIVDVDSQLGSGTKIMLRIPLTLAIISGMQMSVGESIFTIPINNIKQAFKADDGNITYDVDKKEIVMWNDEYIPVVHLSSLYQIDTEIENIKDGILVLIESAKQRYCLYVDALLGEQQIVVKQLPSYLSRFNTKEFGISGCAIIGSGNISLILDAEKLYTAAACC